MTVLTFIYILIFIIFALIAYAVMQLKLFGIKIKDFWTFIDANQMLDKLYKFAMQYENMSPQEQVIYLSEAEKIFNAFDKVPDALWEEEYDKYKEVLNKYKDIKMLGGQKQTTQNKKSCHRQLFLVIFYFHVITISFYFLSSSFFEFLISNNEIFYMFIIR